LDEEAACLGRGGGHEYWTRGRTRRGATWREGLVRKLEESPEERSSAEEAVIAVAVPLRFGAISVTIALLGGCCCPERLHLDIGWGGRPRRRALLIALTVLFGDAEIVLGVLIEIFRGDAVATGGSLPGERDVALEYLRGAPPDLEVGAVAVEGLVSLRWPGLLLELWFAVKAPLWALI
jgi:hypothetical protein